MGPYEANISANKVKPAHLAKHGYMLSIVIKALSYGRNYPVLSIDHCSILFTKLSKLCLLRVFTCRCQKLFPDGPMVHSKSKSFCYVH